MREIYRDEFCRVLAYDSPNVGERGKEYMIVSISSDFLPPHWPNNYAMLGSYKEIEKLLNDDAKRTH